MKKILIFVIVLVLLLGGAGAAGYYFLVLQKQPDHSIIVVDSAQMPVAPPAFSLANRVFVVPDMNGVTTTLNLVAPTASRDYPMGRFIATDGVGQGTLVAVDAFVSPYENSRRAVPIAVNAGGSGEFYYLAVLEGDEMRHATSVPIGDRIKITSVTRSGDQVTISYYVHDRNQPLAEVPTVSTTAIVDIATGALIQAGRNPATEEVVITKNFTGKYRWVKTTLASGQVVTPLVADRFVLTFDTNQLSLETDCNTGGTTFTVGTGSSTSFTVGAIATTKMFCTSSQEADYFAQIGKVANYHETTNGTLTLQAADGATMEFAPIKSKLEFESAAASSASRATTAL